MLLVGFFPLFGGPGYESALAAGLIVPAAAAIGAALEIAAGERSSRARDALSSGAARGAILGLVAYLTTVIHGARVGFCSFSQGTLLFALGPVMGAVLGGAWGGAVGLVARKRKRRRLSAVLLALAGPVAGILVSLGRFYSSPMVFAFDPFFGFFSGTLYDTVIDGTDRLFTHRLVWGAGLGAAIGVAHHLDLRSEAGEGNGTGRLVRGWPAVLTAALLGAFVVGILRGPRLGHFHTVGTIRQELGGFRSGPRCDVVHSRTLRDEDVELFARDCDEEIRAVSSFLGVSRPRHMTAYLFADPGEKRRLMGAAETYIAKPWREEVYLQAAGYPHPVLGHELAHAVSGAFGRGPFEVAGRVLGLLPDPGLIEGIATAASPDDDELSPEAWSRAMIDLGILPAPRSLFSLSFLTHDAPRAYTVAGAFVGYVHRRFGAEKVRAWYAGGDVEALTGRSWDALEREFHDDVMSQPIPPEALSLAKARFGRPAIFSRKCPHEVDADKREAAMKLATGDVRGALAAYDAALAFERRDSTARLGRSTCVERLQGTKAAENELETLVRDGEVVEAARDRAEERLGDLALATGRPEEAERRYDAVSRRVLDEDHLRTLDVKRLAARSELARPAVIALLAGLPRIGTDALTAAEELARWSERDTEDGTPVYLLARSAQQRGQWQRAAARYDEALAKRLELPRVRREAARQRLIAACALSDREGISRALSVWEAAGAPRGNRDTLLRGLASRCVE
jgi:hypothetical protein